MNKKVLVVVGAFTLVLGLMFMSAWLTLIGSMALGGAMLSDCIGGERDE